MAEISWDQLQEVIRNLNAVKKSAAKLLAAYNTHHVKINNRINILAKKNYELQLHFTAANSVIARELTRLRALRAEQNAIERRDPKPVQPVRIRSQSERIPKRPAKRIHDGR